MKLLTSLFVFFLLLFLSCDKQSTSPDPVINTIEQSGIMKISLETPVENLYSVGKTTAKKLEKLGIMKARDLLFYTPFRYQDYSEVKSIDKLEEGEYTTVRGKIELIENKRSFKKKWMITSAMVSDDTGSVPVVWFHGRLFAPHHIDVEKYLCYRSSVLRLDR